METEVKLAFNSKESLKALISLDSFTSLCKDLNIEPKLLENFYLDTKNMTVLSRGGSVRRRHVSGSEVDYYEQTVKYGGGAQKGLHRRHEWNASLNGDFSIEAFKDAADSQDDPKELLDEVFDGLTDEDFEILCSNSFNRTTYKVAYGESLIEACFDIGTIYNSDKSDSEDICELELELISGNIDDLNSLSALIKEISDCVPLDASKYARTLKLVRGIEK